MYITPKYLCNLLPFYKNAFHKFYFYIFELTNSLNKFFIPQTLCFIRFIIVVKVCIKIPVQSLFFSLQMHYSISYIWIQFHTNVSSIILCISSAFIMMVISISEYWNKSSFFKKKKKKIVLVWEVCIKYVRNIFFLELEVSYHTACWEGSDMTSLTVVWVRGVGICGISWGGAEYLYLLS